MSTSESRNGITFSGVLQSVGLLLLRVGIGFTMIRGHGWGKLFNWSDQIDRFPDPIGLGSEITFGLVVFAEVFCALLVVLGLFTRIALIPLVIDMLVAFFIWHSGQAFEQRELALLFLIPFITLLITGPGWYSLDNIRKRRKRKNRAPKNVTIGAGTELDQTGLATGSGGLASEVSDSETTPS